MYQEEKKKSRVFDFDFRYYQPYMEGDFVYSGVYTFKTFNDDSFPYPHRIKNIDIVNNSIVQKFVIYYVEKGNEYSTVDIMLTSNCDVIEFNVDFNGISDPFMDVTINWKENGLITDSVFYTDSNGLGIIKRTKKFDYSRNTLRSLTPANYYPINSVIFVESNSKDKQFVVLNDRS